MKYRLNQNLGIDEARICNNQFGADLEISPAALVAGNAVELPTTAAEYLSKKYPALLEEPRPVRGIAESPTIKGVGDPA